MKKLKQLIKTNRNRIIEYLIYFVLMLVLCRSNIAEKIHPFGFSFAFSLILLQKNAILVSIFYFFSAILQNLTIAGIIEASVTISVLLLLYLFSKFLKRPINMLSTIIFALFSQAGYVYFNLSSASDVFLTISSMAVGILFIYVCYQTLNALIYRGIFSRLTLDEGVCFALFLIALFAGTSHLFISSVNITTLIVVFLILLLSRCFSPFFTIYFSALAGFGIAFSTTSLIYVSIYVTFGTLSASLSKNNKFFAPILIVFADLVLGMFLNAYAYYSFYNLIAIVLVLAIYLCLPKKLFEYIRGQSYYTDVSLANEYVLFGKQKELKRQLEQTSKLFKEMQTAYRNLSVGELDIDNACEILADDVINRHCSTCTKYNKCLSTPAIKKAITDLFRFAIEKGKVSLIDANNLLSSSCQKLNSTIEEVNSAVKIFFEYEKKTKNQDESKMLISQQFGGTSEMISELAQINFSLESINQKISKSILDEWTINRVIVSEVSAIEGEEGIKKVIAIVHNNFVLSPKLCEGLKGVLRIDFEMVYSEMTRLSGWSVVCFVPAPKYDVQIGFCEKGKTENAPSGDTYSFLKLSKTKYMFAISDGMGHGTRANQIASATLSLVESFYRSGFSAQTIMSSVNKIIVPAQKENFASVDVCIVDLMDGTADFVKIGASISLIKKENTTAIIEGESVPVGIVEEVKADVKKHILCERDIIILASDGIVDSFASPETFQNYVNNERVINVQMLASAIMEEAESREGEHKDDKTIIAIKIVKK